MRFQPSLLKKVSAPEAAYSILAVENVVRASILGQNSIRGGLRLMPATRFLATRAIANASQNRNSDDLKLDFAAAARRQDALIVISHRLHLVDGRSAVPSAACRIADQTAATSASSVASAPIETRTIQRPSRTAGVR